MIKPEDLSDLEIFSLTVYGEARGEKVEGQIAVANVIKNRCVNGKTYRDICLAPYQFSCWNKNDPNRNMLLEIGEQLIHNNKVNNIHLKQIQYLVIGIDIGSLLDNTKRARNYLTKNLYRSEKAPLWAKTMTVTAQIGNHIFGIAK